MAVAYDQDVKLRVSVATEGGGDVDNLAAQIEALGQDAGEAQPEFQKLAGALRQMASSQEAAETFRQLKVESQRLRTELDAAASTVDRLDSELTQSRAITAQAAAAQAEAASRTAQAKIRYDDLRISLMSAQNGLKGLVDRSKEAGSNTEIYAGQIAAAKTRVADYKEQLAASRTEVKALSADQKSAATAVKEAETAERGLTREYSQAIGYAKQLSAAVGENNARLESARSVLSSAGIDTKNLAAEQRNLNEEIAKTPGRLQALTDAQKAAAAQAQNLAENQQRMGQVAQAAGNSLNSAFSVTGIRSAGQINAEITRVNQALSVMATSTKVSGDEFNRAYVAGQARIAALTAELKTAEEATSGLGGKTQAMMAGIKSALGPITLALGALATGEQFIRTNIALESLQRALTQITGSSDLAAKEIQWLTQVSDRLGVEVYSVSKAYTSLAASAKGTSLEGEGTRRIFEAVAGSMSRLGKSSADTEGALQAISQMMGKGVVSMEEMRQQLAERLPGAFQAAAEASGVTVGELSEMIASGNVLAEDLLPKLAAGLEKMYGTASRVDGTVSAWNRMKNAVAETFQFIGQSGVMDGLASGLESTAKIVRGMTAGLEAFAKSAGNIAGFVADAWKNPKGSFDRFADAQTKMVETINARLNPSLKSAAAEQGALTAKTVMAKLAADQSVPSWLSVVNAYGKVAKSAEAATAIAVKQAAARDAEGKAAVSLANALGSETEKRDASINAALADADASRNLSNAREREAAIAQAQADALRITAEAEGNVSAKKQEAITKAQEKATALQAEADQAKAAALEAERHAAALLTEKDALADNAGRVAELKAAYESYTQVLAYARTQLEQGAITEQQFTQIQTDAARASALYRDALSDQTAAIQRAGAAKQDQINIDQAGIRLQIEQQRSILAVARARGDEAGAAQAMLRIKRLEIELAELTAKAKQAEAAATLQAVQAKREELAAAGTLTAAKEAELKSQEASARVKQTEAKIAQETANGLRQLARATNNAASMAGQAVGHYNALADSLRGVESAAQGASSAQSGVAEQRDSRMGVTADPMAELYRRGASIEEAKAAAKYYDEFYRRNELQYLSQGFQNYQDMAQQTSRAIGDAVEKALAAGRQELATGKQIDVGTSASDLLSQASSTKKVTSFEEQGRLLRDAGAAANSQPIKRVQIDLKGPSGKRASVYADDNAAADSLIKMLEDSQRRSF